MVYQRLRDRIGIPGALAVITVLWILLVVAVAVATVEMSSMRTHQREGRVLERAEGYDVVSEHAAGGSRTGHTAETMVSGGISDIGNPRMVMVSVTANYVFDSGGDGVDRYLSLARLEGWQLDDPERQESVPGSGEWELRSHGILFGGEGTEDEWGTLFDYCDEISIEARYSDLEDQAALSIELYADSSGCYWAPRD